jgi:hypothetical protein
MERDYEELKREVRLGYFEERGWRGFHDLATLCIAAYRLLVFRTLPLQTSIQGCSKNLLSRRSPHGAPDGAKASRPELGRNYAAPIYHSAYRAPLSRSVLHTAYPKDRPFRLPAQC